MKKVRIYFKSGNKMTIRCRKFEYTIDKDGKKNLEIDTWYEYYMFDLDQIEAYLVEKQKWINIEAFIGWTLGTFIGLTILKLLGFYGGN